ncbi:MAG: hypothetical protein L0214_07140 [candidate division NC10 bacterium]|nr:hypothetical protein [candidate division NC10 bacterium]
MMRKFFVALLAGAVAVGLAVPAFAADLKFTGAYRVRFQFDENLPCLEDVGVPGGIDCSGHTFQTRFRPRFDVETEGGVKGVLRLEIGDVPFGGAATSGTSIKGSGGDRGADGVNVETKWAYIDFPVPATPLRLRAGIQDFFTSKALLLDDDGSGISLYGKLGEINASAWWFRANAGGATTTVGSEGERARDLYAIDLSTSPIKDLNLNLYFVYDHDSETPIAGTSATGFWFGAGAAGKVQNIRWDLDFVYGTKEILPAADQAGWVVDGGVGMALPGTALDLELRGWYATGDKGDGGDNEGYPVLYSGSGGHEPGTQVWGGGGAIDIDATADSPENTWGVGVIATWKATPTFKIAGNVHFIGVVDEGTAASPSAIGDGILAGVDSVGTEVGVKLDYTIAKGLVFTLTAGHLFLGDETVFGVTTFDDVTKIAGVLNYGF